MDEKKVLNIKKFISSGLPVSWATGTLVPPPGGQRHGEQAVLYQNKKLKMGLIQFCIKLKNLKQN